jgi:hypothetical protein
LLCLPTSYANETLLINQDLKGRFVEASQDQYGSRFIQQQFDHANPEDKQMIFEEIVPRQALHLMNSIFGNYVSRTVFLFWCPTPRLGHPEAVRAWHSSSASGALQCHEGEYSNALARCVRVQSCPKGTYYLPTVPAVLTLGIITRPSTAGRPSSNRRLSTN